MTVELSWPGKRPPATVAAAQPHLVETFEPFRFANPASSLVPRPSPLLPNALYHGDNLPTLAHLLDSGFGGKVRLIYADPPYDVEFTQYSKEAFGWDEQVRLAEWLAAHPGPVVLSNQATPRVVKLYEDLGFSLEMHQAPRMISCNGDRTKATEVVAMRNLKP